MNTNRSLLRPLSMLVLAMAACRGPLPVAFVVETPVGSGTWAAVPAEPAWVKAPPRKADHVVVVVDSKSDLRDIARDNLDDAAAREIAARVEAALRTVVPSPEAAAAAAGVPLALRLVQCACRDELLTRDMVVGNRLATVWGLFEVPMAKILSPVTESHRSAARSALAKL